MPVNEMPPLWDTMRASVCAVCFVFGGVVVRQKYMGLVMMMFMLRYDGMLAAFNAFISILFPHP